MNIEGTRWPVRVFTRNGKIVWAGNHEDLTRMGGPNEGDPNPKKEPVDGKNPGTKRPRQ